MIISDELYGKKSNMAYCSCSVTDDFIVKLGDDYFFNYVGKHSSINLLDMIHPDYVDEFKYACTSLEQGKMVRLITFMCDSEGEYSLVDMGITDNDHYIVGNKVIDIEITNLYTVENKYIRLNDDANKYRTFLSMYNDYLFDYDTESNTFSMYVYRSMKPMVVYKKTLDEFEDFVKGYLNNARHKNDFDVFIEKLRNANEGFSVEIVAPLIKDVSKLALYNISCNVIYKHNRKRTVLGIVNSMDNKDETPYYATQEGKDFFTGLLNKKACKEYVMDTIAESKEKHYMAVLDIDNFKNVNDTKGHLYGDKVILKIASIINSTLNGRGIVGRFGGDEFFIFTNWINTEKQFRSILTYLKQKIRDEFGQDDGTSLVTISIGACLYPDDGKDYDSLFNRADKCLYIAKNKGKDRYIIYDPVKHGDFIDDIGKTGFSMAPIKKAEQLAVTIADVSVDIVKNGKDAIERNLPLACKGFEVDGARIYNATKGKLLYHYGEYSKLPEIENIINKESFIEMFDKKHYYTTVYTSNLSAVNKEYYKAINDTNIGGMVCCYFENGNGDDILVCFDTIGRSFSWNESDKNYITTFTKVVASVL